MSTLTLAAGRSVATTGRLLGGTGSDLAAHLRVAGSLAVPEPAVLLAELEAAGLTGRGGAGFPTWRKLAAVGAARRPVVVANAAEGEPASGKDAALLRANPHLVFDGLQVAAAGVGARRVFVYAPAAAVPRLQALLDGRVRAGRDRWAVEVVASPDRFVAGEETAVVRRIDGGLALPRGVPPRVFEKGVGGRATLVSNVETLACTALIARYGGAWFRGVGTAAEPGTVLVTVSGAVARPGVVEVPLGIPVGEVLDAAGGPVAPLAGLLTGGYHGTWLPPEAVAAPLSRAGLAAHGGVLGAGVLVALPVGTCGLKETARAASYLAGEGARQCGPCRNGLPALAAALLRLCRRGAVAGDLAAVRRYAGLVEGRGACHHPDGSARFVRSALQTFAAEAELHVTGRCSGRGADLLPCPAGPRTAQDWR
ncbi:MAG TPA: NADH-ubiquinone oxidoreductase-F iron-sulfur binding region domain-containing protein [Frankiaceae bacterium]